MIRTIVKNLHFSKRQTLDCILKSSSAKYISSASQLPDSHKSEDEWNSIYRLPVIGWAAALCKIKLYQAAVTTVAIPASIAAESSSLIPAGSWIAVSALGITGTVTLFIASYVTQNLIGFIYIDKQQSRLRISYVDFWGKRKNIELRPDELEPPSDKLRLGFLSEVKTANNGTLKLLRRMGYVKDPNIFTYYFGE